MLRTMYLVRRELGKRATVYPVAAPHDEEPRAWAFVPTLGFGDAPPEREYNGRPFSQLCAPGGAAIGYTPDHAFRLLRDSQPADRLQEVLCSG